MIDEFKKIVSSYDIPEKVMQKIEYDISGRGKRKVSLTSLQKEALDNENFWGKIEGNRNLIVQGATSSGKTLIAELLALQCVFSLNKHVVYLVPLKALVSEKVQQFRHDIVEADKRVNIFASSSDYQDHDTELAEGQYDIAVVVYEKFFAMLAEQKDNKFLEKCGLIIVDEIQLLGSQDRGAKLEYSLTKVKNMYGNSVRILGLTTVDCDTNYVNSWLEAVTIKNDQRPIGLKERIISLNGVYWERHVSGENEELSTKCDEHQEGQIEVEDIEKLKNQKVDVKRNALLISLLNKIYSEDPNKKIIVFANSRDRCKVVARNIAKSNVFGRLEVNSVLVSELEKSDDEGERTLLKNDLLPYGIAYHSAALPMSLREVLEQEFKDSDGGIRLLVATETITIGMNLPADVMILYDNQVFRGSDGKLDLKPQEYKNYIGRAGRLGITDKIGESYLFVNSESDIRYYWNQYVNCRIEEVSSALVKATPRQCAPYFLNLLCKGKEETFSEGTIEALANKTLKASEYKQKKENYTIETDKIVKDFEKAELVRPRDIIEDELDDEENSVGYKLTPLGEMLAPYALSIETCFRIKKYFRGDGDVKKEMGGLPVDYSGSDLKKNKYILDILFLVCKMPEVRKITHPRLPDRSVGPNQRKVSQIIQKAIIDYFKKVLNENGEDVFWKNSEIRKTFFDSDILDDDQLTPALRAILLYHWIKGELPSEIRKSAGLDNREFELYTGDLARIGESCSYVIEAISRCLGTNPKRVNQIDCGALEHAFYSLAERLKYGLSNHSLIQVANRHVYGLSRNTIIRMDVAARENDFENINLFVRSANSRVKEFLTDTQRDELMRLMSERYEDKNVENLITKIIADEIVDYSLESDLKTIAHPRDKKEWIVSLREIFTQLKVTTKKITDPECLQKLQWANRTMHIVALFGNVAENTDYESYREKLTGGLKDKIVFVYNKDALPSSECDDDITISAEFFCKIILEFLAMSDSANGGLICEYLYNQTGSISDKGIAYLQKQINDILSEQLTGVKEQVEELEKSSYENYIEKFNYIDMGELDSSDVAHAKMHKVRGKHDNAFFVIKEITIPENSEEFEFLNEEAKEIYSHYFLKNDNPDIREIINDRWPEVFKSDKDYEDVNKFCNERKKQLAVEETEKDFYFIQSLTFYMEGYKRLNEVRNVSKIKGAEQHHIVVGANSEIYHTDFWNKTLKTVDTRFNNLETDFFFAMKAMDGSINEEDKRSELNNNKSEVLLIAKQISEALISCHAEKIWHRDIKPANILYIGDKYCLCDFGCATNRDFGKTSGVGTEGYMAPECFNGEYSERSDLYSLAKTLKKCYVGNTNVDENDDDLLKVLNKACNKNPDERYKDVREFLDVISRIKP